MDVLAVTSRVSITLLQLCLLFPLAGCGRGSDGQGEVSEHDRTRIVAAIEAVRGLRDDDAYARPKYAGFRQQMDFAAHLLSSMTATDLNQSNVISGLIAYTEEMAFVGAYWIADEPRARYIRVASPQDSVTLPMGSYNIDANAADVAVTVLFHAESSVEDQEPQWSSLMKIVHGNEPIDLAILDEQETVLDEIEPVVVNAGEPDQRPILRAPPDRTGDHPLLAAVFAELPPSLRASQWHQTEAGERTINSWLRDNIVGRRIALDLECEFVEKWDDEMAIQLEMVHPKDSGGTDIGYLDGVKIQIVHVGIGRIFLPFDESLYDSLAATSESDDQSVTAVFEVDYVNVFSNQRGEWGFDIGLKNGVLLEMDDKVQRSSGQ